MKVRQGFISNSSTTSFIALIHPKMGEAVELVINHSKNKDAYYGPLWKRKKEIEKEVVHLGKDVLYLEELLCSVRQLGTKDAIKLHTILLHQT